MTDNNNKNPDCYGNLETVFPLGKDGLRHTPGVCLKCKLKTPCLKAGLNGPKGVAVKEEVLDRSYEAGITGFWERWSRKKAFHQKKNKPRDSK
jgi:hypothetical protein